VTGTWNPVNGDRNWNFAASRMECRGMHSSTRDILGADLRSAVRSLRHWRVTSASAVLTLAVAVGLNLAMFGLIDRALLSPPAHVVDADRVFAVGFAAPSRDGAPSWMTTASYVAFETIRDQVPGIEAAAWQRRTAAAVIDGTQISVDAMLVSGSYFPMLGAKPLFGRGVLPDDDRAPAGSPVAVLSYPFWIGTFGGDRAVLGRRISVQGTDMTIAGVMPAGFSGHSSARVDVWIPFRAAMRDNPGWDTNQFLNVASVIVRVPPAAGPVAAGEQATAVLQRRVILEAIGGAEVSSAERRIAYWLTGVSVLVLLLGAANAATLLLVRGATRRRDLAIRAALGASRLRLVLQILLEAALLASSAVLAALFLAYWFDEAVRRVLLPSIVEGGGVNMRLLFVALCAGSVAFIAAAAAGLAQLPERSRIDWQPSSGSTRLAAGGRVFASARSGRALLVTQTALSVLLLAGAGLFGRSLVNLTSQDFGMRMSGVLLVDLERGSRPIAGRDALFASALEQVRVLPGIEAATVVQMVPFTGFHVVPVSIPGRTEPPNVSGQLPYLIAATPELFDILDIRVVAGRRIVASDDRGSPVVVINETMARAAWAGESAVGKCIRIGFEPSFDPFSGMEPPPLTTVPCREVIGVVRDLRQRSVVPTGNEAHLMQYYVPFSQVPQPPHGEGGPGIQGLLLRTELAPGAIAPSLRRMVAQGRTDLPFVQVRRYADLLERQVRPWRQGTTLLALFGGLALVVAAVGLYAAFAHSVEERRREMAIRLAIGARAGAVVAMILREAGVLAIAGVACGAVLTLSAGRWLEPLLFRTRAWDPVVLGTAAVVMLVVAIGATLLPARTAARADPSALLK
jgi:predicted permease